MRFTFLVRGPARTCALFSLSILACASPKADTGDGSEGSSGSSTTELTTTGKPTHTSGPEDTLGGDSSSGSTFVILPDAMISPPECDQWAQDCPEDQKCMPYDSDADFSWDSLKCVPLGGAPAAVGSECVAEGSGSSGVDNCEKKAMCWNTDENGVGVCVALCDGLPDSPDCPDPSTSCSITNEGVLTLCLPQCDPLIQDCPGNDLCIYNPVAAEDFICVLDASGEQGKSFDACGYLNACDLGHLCLLPSLASECDSSAEGCCLPFCDTDMPNTCPGEGQECLPWYDEGQAPPGKENIGFCAIPQ